MEGRNLSTGGKDISSLHAAMRKARVFEENVIISLPKVVAQTEATAQRTLVNILSLSTFYTFESR